MIRVNWKGFARRIAVAAGAWRSKPLPIAAEVHTKQFLLVHLPVDLLLDILDNLPPEDRLSLALTCKCLYAICPASAINTLSVQGKTDLLQRLERDIGHQYSFCPECVKLHAFHRDLGAQFRDHVGRTIRQACFSGSFSPLIAWTRGSRDLNYQMARLLWMNHRYGPPTGISPEEFCRDHERPAGKSWLSDRWHVGLEIKFIDNQMLLKATHYIQGNSIAQLLQFPRIIINYAAIVMPWTPARRDDPGSQYPP